MAVMSVMTRTKKSSEETIVRLKKIKLSLEDKPGNRLLRLSKNYKQTVGEGNYDFETFKTVYNPLTNALANIMGIMENGHYTSSDDINDIEIVKAYSKSDMEIRFTRFRNCKKQPIVLLIGEFKTGFPQINPAIQE